ncbi:MAG: hypothetical protein ABIJ96_04630 [Elusimicrobiota bacterium]
MRVKSAVFFTIAALLGVASYSHGALPGGLAAGARLWAAAGTEVPAIDNGGVVFEPEKLRLRGETRKGDYQQVPAAAPEASVHLGAIFNRQWKQAEVLGIADDQLFLSITFDLEGDAYLSIMAAQWEQPNFYKLERTLHGEWELPGGKYSVDLDVSIFRERISNYIVIRKEGVEQPVYRKRIKHLLLQAYLSGRRITLGGREYMVFFSFDLDGANKPAQMRKDKFGIVLVHDDRDGEEHNFYTYIIAYSDLTADQVLRKEFFGDYPAGLRIAEDNTTLEIYGLSKP